MNTHKATGESAASQRDLATLDELYKKYVDAHTKATDAMLGAIADAEAATAGLRKAAKGAGAKFDLFRKRMAKTKFDYVNGEYFYAEDDGKEVYRVKVVRTYETVVEVSAKDAQSAIEEAKDKVINQEAQLKDKGLTAEDVSR